VGFLCSFLIGHTFKLNRHTHKHPQLSMCIFHLLLRTHKLCFTLASACLLVCMGVWGGVFTSVCMYIHTCTGGWGSCSCRRLSLLSRSCSLSHDKYKFVWEVYEIGAQLCKPYLGLIFHAPNMPTYIAILCPLSTRGVSHSLLAIYIKMYLKAKEEL
jgi:hypothetical protein